ncbi:hypothetical protein GEMRC1_010447 [Eukaryota sp. GEM-RC1]
MSSLARRFGQRHFSFVPATFVLPQEASALRKFHNTTPAAKYIKKPKSGANGINIKLLNNLNDFNFSKASCVIQSYIPSYLIDGYKFDCRIYVAVTSIDPLIIYVYSNGLGRFATVRMNAKSSSTSRLMHLTNFSIQKKQKNFVPNQSLENDGEGSKWSLKALMSHLESEGHDIDRLYSDIYDVIIKTIISVEGEINTRLKMVSQMKKPAFELYGFDILLDTDLKPWLIEVNTSPSMNGATPIDKSIKSRLWSSLLTMLRCQPFDGNQILENFEDERRSRLFGRGRPKTAKRSNINVFEDNNWLRLISDYELDVICDYEDELSLARDFVPIFPCVSEEYQQYFAFNRHLNTLLAQWLKLREQKGSDYCLRKLSNECRRRLI